MPSINTIFILFFLLQSGTILFYGMPIASALPVLMIPFFKDIRINSGFFGKALLLIGVFGVFSLMQYLMFTGILKSEVLSMLNLLTALCFVIVVGNRFVDLYTSLMIFLSVTSLFFYVGILVVPELADVFRDFASTLPIYEKAATFFSIHGGEESSVHMWLYHLNFDANAYTRNNGIFYEPGRFAIYLILALIFVLFVKNESIFSWKSLMLIGTLLSTLSTAGYASFVMILYLYSSVGRKNVLSGFILVVIAICVTVYLFSLDFMSQKIAFEVVNSDEYSRFGAMIYHWGFIEKHLFLGYGNYLPELMLSPNGLTFLLLKHGLLIALLLLYGVYKSFSTFSLMGSKLKRMQVLCTFAFLIVCFSQTITTDPFFYAMSFFGYVGYRNVS